MLMLAKPQASTRLVTVLALFTLAVVYLSCGVLRNGKDILLQPAKVAAPPTISGARAEARWSKCPACCADPVRSLLCTPSGFTWLQSAQGFLDGDRACSQLKRCRYNSLAFVGDSYIRHLMQAFTLLLTADYEYGSMLSSGRTPGCRGEGQFEEKVCRTHVNPAVTVCGGQLTLKLDSGSWPVVGPQHAAYDAVFWGAGRHPTDVNYETRHGVHNASAVFETFIHPLCVRSQEHKQWVADGSAGRQRVYWLLEHARRLPGHPDEQPDVIRRFNTEMVQMMGGVCQVPSIDLYTPTARLIEQLPHDAANMTFDGAHWGRGINLVLAQLLLQQLLESCGQL